MNARKTPITKKLNAATALEQMDEASVRPMLGAGRQATTTLPAKWAPKSRFIDVAQADAGIVLSPTLREPERHPRTRELFDLPGGSPWAGRLLYFNIPSVIPESFEGATDAALKDCLYISEFMYVDVVHGTCQDKDDAHRIVSIQEAISRTLNSLKKRKGQSCEKIEKLYANWVFNRTQPTPDPHQYTLGVSVHHQWKQRMSCQRAWESCTNPMPQKNMAKTGCGQKSSLVFIREEKTIHL